MEQLERVRELGCDYGQGFLFARPLDPIRATAFLADPRDPATGMPDGDEVLESVG